MKYRLPKHVQISCDARDGNNDALTVCKHDGTRSERHLQREDLSDLAVHPGPRHRDDNGVSNNERATGQNCH